jgi:hypothetical protein
MCDTDGLALFVLGYRSHSAAIIDGNGRASQLSLIEQRGLSMGARLQHARGELFARAGS